MKKLTILCSALLLALTSVGCGSSSDSSSASSDSALSEAVEPTTKWIKYYDPFENLNVDIECENSINIIESTSTFPPSEFKVVLDSKSVPFTKAFDDYSYTTTLESIDLNSVTIKLTLEEDTVKSIEKEDIKLDPIEKEYIIPTDAFEKFFFSDSQLTSDLKNNLIDNVKNYILESESIDIEKDSLTPVKLYYISHDFPDYYQIAYDQNSFHSEDYLSENEYTFAVIFKNAANQHVALLSSAVLSPDSTEVKSVDVKILSDINSGISFNEWFDSESDAYNRILEMLEINTSDLKEFPIT